MPVWIILIATALYLGGLFIMAWQRDKRAANPGFRPNPTLYALALGVYCTSWTYFGAVGTAAASGWEYLAIYLGPIIVFLVLPGLVRKIALVARREGITSLSDFLSARYGKSQMVATVATLAAVAGSLPYISLQLKSIGMSFSALSAPSGLAGESAPADETVLICAFALAGFAILFGARHTDTTRHNPGLMRVLAFEAVFKLAALAAIALLSLAILGRPDVTLSPAAQSTFGIESVSGRFITITILSMAAIICLPRQFHVAFIERRGDRDDGRARWAFPLYLAATSLAVVPITLAGLSVLPAGSAPDLFVMSLPLLEGDGLMALLVFLGGFSAAMGMVIVSTIALSTMVTNDLIVPALIKTGRFASLSGDSGVRLLNLRRFVIFALLLLAYGYFKAAGSSEALAQIGLLSFAAAIQFAPALVGAVYWSKARRTGVVVGMVLGMAMWSYTLFLPAILGHTTMVSVMPPALDPHALLGLNFGDSLTHGVFWSLIVNLAAFIAGSLQTKERLRDRIQAAAFTGDIDGANAPSSEAAIPASRVTPNGLKTLAARFLDENAVSAAFDQFKADTGSRLLGDEPADWRLVQRTERMLASALGASSARVVMASAIGGLDVALPDVLSILDTQTRAERFDRHMLQSMLEHISHGVSVVDSDQRLVAWNSTYVDLFNYPANLVVIGRPIGDLIAHNISTGWIHGDPAEVAERRIEHMKLGRSHAYERQNPDGRHLRITGNPMPGGGYVTTFADITLDKHREKALIEANETLEIRVRDRTRALEDMASDLRIAREDAEGANASKTRFLAAASHDLLQPLNAARLFLGSLLTDSAPASDRARQTIIRADKAIQSADDLLKGLLDISRLDHGDVAPKPVTLAIAPLLEDLVDEAQPMAEKAGLEIRVAPTSLTVIADPDFLTSILRNLISNARRYTSKGGVLIGVRKRGSFARIEVWDTGPGISHTRQALLFDEFQRFEEADNLGLRGAGLGLSIVQRMAKIMDAKVIVRSRIGSGSVFSIDVPLGNAIGKPKPQKSSQALRLHPSMAGLTVACIDDEIAIQDGMQALLSSFGCHVKTYGSIEAFMSDLDHHRFDALVADYQLRDAKTGFDLIETVRRSVSHPDNVALLTAKNTAALMKQTRDAAIAYLHKPANPDALREFLNACAARLTTQAAE
ncbi:MAG: PAS domain-containing hybrid sensor histidine kinase/response regulator [Pseudomonadota bacterium]